MNGVRGSMSNTSNDIKEWANLWNLDILGIAEVIVNWKKSKKESQNEGKNTRVVQMIESIGAIKHVR